MSRTISVNKFILYIVGNTMFASYSQHNNKQIEKSRFINHIELSGCKIYYEPTPIHSIF